MAYIDDMAHHDYYLGRMVAIFDKVGRYPTTQILRLADIYNMVVAIHKLIYTRGVWQGGNLLFDMLAYRLVHTAKVYNFSQKYLFLVKIEVLFAK